MHADGSDTVNLTNNPAGDFFPSWSPDGMTVAFSSFRDGNWEIYTIDVDGTHPINLTNYSAVDIDPSWSPDGTKIDGLVKSLIVV